tara:strand:+ start:134 stop:376 length:243 start_codon:yes stop_codon:yes gene_type:complete
LELLDLALVLLLQDTLLVAVAVVDMVPLALLVVMVEEHKVVVVLVKWMVFMQHQLLVVEAVVQDIMVVMVWVAKVDQVLL